LGGAWDWPPSREARLGASALERLRAAAAAATHGFAGATHWGWKDPRTSLTLPFWTGLFPRAKVLMVVRNPLAVYDSLRRRQFSSMAFALNLWRGYAERSLADAPPEGRVVTHYDAYFHDPAAEIRRVLTLLEMPATDEIVARCCAAKRADLRHSRFTLDQLREATSRPEIVDLYVRLCREAAWGDAPAPPEANVVRSPGDLRFSAADEAPPDAISSDDTSAAQEAAHGRPAGSDGWGKGLGRLDDVALRELLRRQVEWLRKGVATRDARITQLEAQLADAREALAREGRER
jgi:hypothetical protein